MNSSQTLVNDSQRFVWRGLLGPCVRGALFVALVTGLAYPLVTTAVAQWLMPESASGSLIKQDDRVLGSALIGQHFTHESYFHARPSATSEPYNAASSVGSNQGPTNATLIDSVRQRVQDYRQLNGLAKDAQVPVDAVTASASGLDPHISVANAQMQIARVAKAREVSAEVVQALVSQHTEGRLLGVLGEPRLNVVLLNLALDAKAPVSPSRVAPISDSVEDETHVQ